MQALQTSGHRTAKKDCQQDSVDKQNKQVHIFVPSYIHISLLRPTVITTTRIGKKKTNIEAFSPRPHSPPESCCKSCILLQNKGALYHGAVLKGFAVEICSGHCCCSLCKTEERDATQMNTGDSFFGKG